jgi:AraC-like DNA-binding protein
VPYESYIPAYPLSDFVALFWMATNDGNSAALSRVVPHGAVELIISLDRATLSFSDGITREVIKAPLWAGPYSRSFLIDESEFTKVVGVRFKPGKARAFLPVPAHELENLDAPLEAFCPREAARLADQVLSARKVSEAFRRLEGYLTSKLGRASNAPRAVDRAVEEFQCRPGARTISAVQADTGFSHTRFIQLFREHVGLTPSVFCRVQRFQRVLREVEGGRPVRWSDVALGCGYFDQAHFIRDFRAFSGVTPGQYLRDLGARPR